MKVSSMYRDQAYLNVPFQFKYFKDDILCTQLVLHHSFPIHDKFMLKLG